MGKKFKTKKAALVANAPSDIKPVYGKDGKIKYWVEKKDPDRHRNIRGLTIRKA
tara:strand:+ start:710 stop:871 length:162 start_codon:yes stop_codon:yes gene_type:complete